MAWLLGIALTILILLLIFLIVPFSDWRALWGWLRGKRERPASAPATETERPAGGKPEPRPARPGLLTRLRHALGRRRAASSERPGVSAAEEGPAPVTAPERLLHAAPRAEAEAPPDAVVRRHATDAQWAAGERSPDLPATVQRRTPEGRDWQEETPAAATEAKGWAEGVGRRILNRLSGTRAEAGQPPAAAQTAAAQTMTFRPGLVALIAVVLVAILVITLLPGGPQPPQPAPPRAHHLTIVLAGLGEIDDTVVVTDDVQARERLRSGLQERLDSDGLSALVTLRSRGDRPAFSTAAYSLTVASQADLLLWGTRQEGGSYSALTLTVIPHTDPEVPEFEEYLWLMLTPRHFPLARSDEGLAAADLDKFLPWLAHFYLGEFDRIEDRSPTDLRVPTLAPEVLTFHWAGLLWFKGDYPLAQGEYGRMVGYRFVTDLGEGGPPTLVPEEALPDLLAASRNNAAAVLLLRQSLGEVSHAEQRTAIEWLEQAVQAAPEAAVPRYNLGRAYLAQRRWSEAVRTLEKAVQLDGRHVLAMAALSEAYHGVGNAGKCKEYADRALQVYADLPEGHLALARYYLAWRNIEEAAKELDKSLTLAENEVRRRRAREVAARGGPNPQLVRADYLKAWGDRTTPLLAQIHLTRANLLLLKGQIEGPPDFFDFLWTLLTGEQDTLGKALEEVQQARKLHPNWYEAGCLEGEIRWSRGLNKDAIKAVEQARSLDEQDVETYLILARMHLERWRALRAEQRFDDARAERERAAAQYRALIDGDIAPARGYFGLGEIAQEEERWGDARNAFREAIRFDRTYGEAYLHLGLVEYQLASDPLDQPAMAALEKAVENAGLLNWLRVAGQTERGEILLEQYLRSKGEEGATPDLLNLARQEFEQARQDAAAETAFPLRTGGVVILLSGQPSRSYLVRALAGLGRIAFEQEQYDRAVAFYQEALQKDPWCFAARYGLGRVYLVQRNGGAALPELEKAVQVNPDSISAQYYLREAYYAQYRDQEAQAVGRRVAELCGRLGEQGRPRADDVEACAKYEQKR